MIEIKNLRKNYGKTTALNNISLTINQGEIIGLFGENGAGKTTLIKSVFHFIKHSGDVLLDGKPIDHSNIDQLSFASCEHTFFPTLTANDHKEFYQMHFDHFREKRFDGLMSFFQLPMDKPIQSLSKGQQDQFEVIMALSQGAHYIFMDEPFVSSDIFNRADFYKVLLGILEPEETIILSTHLIEEISGFIDRAILIHKGQIIGDKHISQLEDEGSSLMDYIKQTYAYKEDRVSKALASITGKED